MKIFSAVKLDIGLFALVGGAIYATKFLQLSGELREFAIVGIVGLGFGVLAWSRLKKSNQEAYLYTNIHKFKDSLSGTVEQIQNSCLQLGETSGSQASAIAQTSASCHEVSALTARNSENFNHVNRSVIEIHETVKDGVHSLEKLETNLKNSELANEQVIAMMSETEVRLGGMTKLFDEVVAKTGIINDIVFQTKLLSFNASVEAARAGQHGKGFAVVAEEIGNLAQVSGESSNAIRSTLEKTQIQIGEMIKEISKNSESITRLLKEQADVSRTTMEEFGRNFDSVTLGTERIKSQIQEAAAAVDEQAKAMQEINDATLDVNESIQRNTLVVGQTENLAKELAKNVFGFTDLLSDISGFEDQDGGDLDLIPWSDQYAIGVHDMDDEHQVLLSRINDLITAMNSNDKKEISRTFNSLVDYTVGHFTREEEFMRSFSYPSFESHKRVHENLIGAMERFGQKIKEGTLEKPKLASFLKNWLFTHIMGVDTKYASDYFEKSNGKKIA